MSLPIFIPPDLPPPSEVVPTSLAEILSQDTQTVSLPGGSQFESPIARSSEVTDERFFEQENQGQYHFGPILLGAVLAQIVFNVVMSIKYASASSDQELAFYRQNTTMLWFAILGLVLFFFFQGKPSIGLYKGMTTVLILGGVLPILIEGVLQFAFGIIERLKIAAVTPLETFLFYVSVAISEEILFRVGIQTTISSLLKRVLPRVYAGAIAVGITATIFAYVHSFVYAEDFSAIITIFAVGVGLGLIIEIPARGKYVLDAAVLGHFVLNGYIGFQYIQSQFGGF